MSSLAPTLVHAGREEAVLFPAARTTRRTWLGIGVVLATLAVAFPWVGASVGLSAAWGLKSWTIISRKPSPKRRIRAPL